MAAAFEVAALAAALVAVAVADVVPVARVVALVLVVVDAVDAEAFRVPQLARPFLHCCWASRSEGLFLIH